MRPAISPQVRAITIGTMTGKSANAGVNAKVGLGLPFTMAVWPNAMANMAEAPTIDPDDRSMPPEMMTCVTPQLVEEHVLGRVQIEQKTVLQEKTADEFESKHDNNKCGEDI
jgi:hypothetical protein